MHDTECRLVLLSYFTRAKLWGLLTKVRGRGAMKKACKCVDEDGGSNLVSIYEFRRYIFDFFEDFLDKKKKKINDQGNGGFIEVTSE